MEFDVKRPLSDGHDIIGAHGADLYVVKGFCSELVAKNTVQEAHVLMKKAPNRQKSDGLFFSFDVLPTGAKTERIFRTIVIDDPNSTAVVGFQDLFSRMKDFQEAYLFDPKNLDAGQKRRLQLIHYPRGGGFFDWHEHPRYPVNYGMIVNLSRKGLNFTEGATEIIRDNGDKICVEDFTDVGDLILFRYDLKHRVAPCNPHDDLTFDANGRWTAIMPIY